MSRPALPSVAAAVTGANAEGSKYLHVLLAQVPATGLLLRICTGPTIFTVCVFPGALSNVAPAPLSVTVNGVPLIALKTQFSCHPPARAAAIPECAYLLPCPNGSEYKP